MKTVVTHNIETGEITQRDMTTEELAEFESNKIAAEAKVQLKAEAAVAKAALLAKLGITEEEAKLLLS